MVGTDVISYIVSVFDRIGMLNACLACLDVQQHIADITVCVNSTSPNVFERALENPIGKYLATGNAGAKGCYESANMVWTGTFGEWLCFPSDDSLYVADFSRIMLATANKTDADVVYCDCIYRVGTSGNNIWKDYTILESEPRMGKIDKTNFIVRRSLFKGFPEHPRDWRDGALIEKLKTEGATFAKAPGVLVVHQ